MASIPGTVKLIGVAATPDSGDTFAVIDPKYGIDGHRSVANISEMQSITTARRKEGMTVWVQNTQELYRLVGGITNSDWALETDSSVINDALSASTSKTWSIDKIKTQLNRVFEVSTPSYSWLIDLTTLIDGELQYAPNVTIIDATENIVEAEVVYNLALKQIVINFTSLQTGKVILS